MNAASRIPDPGSRIFFLTGLLLLTLTSPAQVKTGADQTGLYYPLLQGKRLGVVANNASILGKRNIVDTLKLQGSDVVRIFSPEHGFRMNGDAGQFIGNSTDPATGIPVVSLYGKHFKPSIDDLKDIDLVLFDIQDVGVRFYTYISTLTYIMEACAENKIPMILLDRPNPNAFYIDGPILEKEFASFVGLHPVPVVYGMTIGEYARMINGEGWLNNAVRCDLRVIPLAGYTHQTRYDLPVKPSPNLVNMNAVYLYPSLCFFEGTIISIGRGTSSPFEVFGHPELHSETYSFTPHSIPGLSIHPPFEGKKCHGVDLRNYFQEHPEERGKIILTWLLAECRGWKDKTKFFTGYFNKMAGSATLQKQIIQGKTETEIRESWQPGIEKFKIIREKYLIYK